MKLVSIIFYPEPQPILSKYSERLLSDRRTEEQNFARQSILEKPDNKKSPCRRGRGFRKIILNNYVVLVFQFHLHVFAVKTGDVAQRNVLRTLSGTSTCVSTVTETEFVHLAYHSAYTACCFHSTLRKKSELANLRRNEEHGRTVLTSCNAGTATDTSS